MQDRPYQQRTIAAVEERWSQGAKSVLVVAPTGAGKTHMGARLVADRKALWVAHRRELVLQAVERLRREFGSNAVGCIMPGEEQNARARIQVGTVQTLLAREHRLDSELIVLDEAHHYLAEDWRSLLDRYDSSKCLGLTATPERQDGEPLGDMFEELVVSAHYSELVRDGHLVPARVLQPTESLGNDLAQDPLDAYLQHGDTSQVFCFAYRVATAEAWAKRWRESGILAETIHAETTKRDRDEALERFRTGRIRCLHNVNTLTEGVDVPQARVAILARSFGHVGGYLQAVGRVLRPSEGKRDAIVIDLTGATLKHGMPNDDREYSLTGRAISSTARAGSIIDRSPNDDQSVRGSSLKMVAFGAIEYSRASFADDVYQASKRGDWGQVMVLVSERSKEHA